MCGRLPAGKLPQYFAEPPGQLNLLPSVGREMSTGQSAVMLCVWGVKTGCRLIPLCRQTWVAGKTVRSLVHTCQHVVKRYTINILFTCYRKPNSITLSS